MPLNGSGGVTQPAGSLYPAVPSTLIQSAKANASIADIYTILASAIYKDGQQVSTQRVPFAAGISTDTVTEKTATTGVTLDSVLLKDGRIDTTQGADITCAATINLETATGNVVDVTGSTGPVTAITLSQGHWRIVRFTGTPTLTNGASLVLPDAADYTATAGDYILFMGYAAGVVRAYIFPTNGPIPFVDSSPVIVGSADKTKKVRFEVDGLTTATTRVLTVQDSDDTLVGRATTDTLTNKTLTSAVLNTGVSGTAVAAQSDQEAGSSTSLIVTSGRQHFHPSAIQARAKWTSAGTPSVTGAYNVSGVVKNSTGNYTVSFTVPFSSADYAYAFGALDTGGSLSAVVASQLAGSINVIFRNAAAAPTDSNAMTVMCSGDL